ncbi:MAG: MATE family efflux transporter [Eubacterium sp.]|nr:MATE family efflux transporter [Eubacterium sp.]
MGKQIEEQRKENKMGVMPVRKLVISMSLPMMISMLVQALYNIVDSMFVSYISQDALAAVTLAFPMQGLMIALGSGTGVGINAYLSRSLGERRFQQANDAANNGLFLAFCCYLVFLALGLSCGHWFISIQTDDPEIVQAGSTYLTIVCCLSLALFYQMTFERLLQSTGLTFYSMISQVTGAVINMIMDPILIFGLLGAPKLGIAGAAIATIFGQTAATIIGLTLNVKKNKEIQLSFQAILHPKWAVIKRIYSVGIPTILMMSVGSVMNYAMNHILIAFSSTAVAVFGVYFRLQSFIFMPIFGLNNGIVPVVAYNYGAKKKSRILETLKFALMFAITIMVCGLIVFELFPEVLLGIFNASDEMLALGVPAMRIIALHFPIAAVCIVLGSVFQAFGRGTYSLINSVLRQLFALLPAAWLLAQTGNVSNVWWAFLIAEGVSLLVTSILFRKLYKDVIEPM